MKTTHRHGEDSELGDAGSIVVGWLGKLVIGGAIFGLFAFDGISVGVGHLSAADDCSTAVQAASQNFLTTKSVTAAYAAAVAVVNNHEKVNTTGFAIQPDGTTALSLTDTVHTLVLFRTSQTKGLAIITVTCSGKYTGS